MSKKKLLIFGTSSLAENLLFYLENDETEYEVIAFLKSENALKDSPEQEFKGYPVEVFDNIESKYPPSEYEMIIAAGYKGLNKLRAEYFAKAKAKGYKLANYICSTTSRWKDLVLGENIIIFDRNIIQPFVKIGDGVILSRGNSIGHNSIIGEFTFIANTVTLCGFNEIGSMSFLGSSCTISDDVKIAERNLIGASSFIKRDTKFGEVYAVSQSPKLDKTSDSFFNW